MAWHVLTGDEVYNFRQYLSPQEDSRVHKTPEMIKQSIIRKLKLPPFLQERLAPLSGLCTYELLEDVRSRYQDSDTTTPSSSEHFPQERIPSKQWGCMGEELLALDKATRVPRDAPEIQEIYKAVRSVPEFIAEQIPCEIIDIGSFSCDTKIVNIDEFDFLLMTSSSIINTDAIITLFHSGLTYEEFEFITTSSREDMLTTEPQISKIFNHGPALCIQISWKCKDKNHVHKVDIDLTNGVIDLTMTFKSFMHHMQTIPVLKEFYKTIHDSEPCVMVNQSRSLSILENRLFQMIDNVYPHATAAYRLLKLFIKQTLPMYDQSLSHDRINRLCGTFGTSREHRPLLSSHDLKQVFLHILVTYPEPAAWEKEVLHLRLADMFSSLDGDLPFNGVLKTFSAFEQESLESYVTMDRDRRKMTSILFSKRMKACFKTIQRIKTLLVHKYDKSHHAIEPSTPFPPDATCLIEIGDVYNLWTSPVSEIPYLFIKHIPILKIDNTKMEYRHHPLIKWIEHHKKKKFSKTSGRILSKEDWKEIQVLLIATGVGIMVNSEWSDFMVTKQIADIEEIFDKNFGSADDERSKSYLRKCLLCSLNLIDEAMTFRNEFSNLYWDPMAVIYQSLRKLPMHERAFLRKLVDKNMMEPIAYTLEANAVYISSSIFSPALRDFFKAFEYLHLLMHRSSNVNPYPTLRATDIVGFCCCYILGFDENYFIGLTMHNSFLAMDHITLFHTTIGECLTKANKYKNKWKVVKIEKDVQNLERCIYAYVHPKLWTASRLSSGELLGAEAFSDERLGISLISSYSKHCRTGETILSYVHQYLTEVCHHSEKRNVPSAYNRCNVDMLLFSYLLDCRVDLYDRTEENFILIRSLGDHKNQTIAPLSLLLTHIQGTSTVHYDLLLPGDSNAKDYDELWDIAQRKIYRIFKECNLGDIKDFQLRHFKSLRSYD